MTWTLGFLPVFLLLLGFPIFLVLLTAATATLVLFMNVPLMVLQQTLFASVNVYALLALPFFIFAGEIMDRGSIAERLVGLVSASIGKVPGKIPVTAVGAGAIFGAISGVGAASVATVGKVMYPSMKNAGYNDGFSSGLLVSVGAAGVILPPSIPMIVYAAAADQSIPRLYAAGIGPGLLVIALLTLYCFWVGRRNRNDNAQSFGLKQFIRSFQRGVWALGVPVVIIGGIYGGVFSPTEAAAVACLYAALVTVVALRDLTLKGLLDAAVSTVRFSAQILIIVACAGVFSWMITVNQIPTQLVQWITEADLASWQLLMVINLLLLLIGCVLDPLSAILLLSPLLVPITAAAGIDPIHFGMILTLNLAIGLFTPPFGINIFVMQSLFHTPLTTIYRGITPFLILYFIALLAVTYLPGISQFGVDLLM
ncbi:TRAP transporter large permease [Pusillimonas sp. DMV24BSW_D]|uniref:TRAP transporter large permease n=1 Tax=Neopusillimonas aestuarii TaxID=2716226 RepID=UPI00140BD35D|nr:TRAP transporter large permease [Pusillimonas sp. DMV24BSW_D]QIM48007.1 TRAP transporter large permease [Pusillimonas sp. DMV24BSW_D]